MNWLENTKYLQIEITSYCNAHCGACQRHASPVDDTLHPQLELQHMDLNLWRSIIDQAYDLNFETINLNGNFGDAGMHPDLLKMANHLFASSDMKLQISTNGSLRTKQFWKELAQSGTNRLQVIFCVDGLKDTHAIYRRKTNFDKIIDNIKAFTSAGGNAIMVTTLFDHNIHQIKELAKLAKDIGCMEYRTRKSYSFTDYNSLDDVVVSTNNIKDEDAYITKYKSVYSGRPKYRTHNQSKCPWYNKKHVQIDPYGQIWNCCYASETRYGKDKQNYVHPDAKELFNSELDLTKNTLEQALQSKHWALSKDRIEEEKWYICYNSCGLESNKEIWENYNG